MPDGMKICPKCNGMKLLSWFRDGEEWCQWCMDAAKDDAAKRAAPRLCRMCREEKPLADFYVSGSYCKACMQRLSQEQTLKRYGLTMPEYLVMADDQNNECVICGKEESELGRNGEVRMLHLFRVDHAEGLLCNHCFKKLKPFRGDVEWLLKAAEFLS